MQEETCQEQGKSKSQLFANAPLKLLPARFSIELNEILPKIESSAKITKTKKNR